MRRWSLLLLIATACGGSDDPMVSTTCDGRNLTTHDASGKPTTVVCPLTCEVDHCTAGTNIPIEIQSACTSDAPAFTASTGATLNSTLDLNCNGCQAPIQRPQRVEAGVIDLAVYCLSHFEVGAGKTLPVADGLDTAIVFFVAGDVLIDGTIDLAGDTMSPGAGGFIGAAAASEGGVGEAGNGPCRGLGGGTTPNAANNIGAGGGGAGNFTAGASGGPARDIAMNQTAAGPGGIKCEMDTLSPLIGGSSGGGGGDGACTGALANACGRPGGGGGGAIQIVATGTITIGATGAIKVNGGPGGSTGPGDEGGGGGGGGAGGSILLEANELSIAGMLDVAGGSGGATGASMGGIGGTPDTTPELGKNPLTQPEGGSGGGGAAGFVRLGANIGATCPHPACASGPLENAP